MRILLAAPSRRDPAHRRVLTCLHRELAESGDSVRLFPPAQKLDARRLRLSLESALGRIDVLHVQYFSRGFECLAGIRIPERLHLILTHQGATFRFMENRAVFETLARQSQTVTCVSRQGLKEMLELCPALRGKAVWIPNGADFAAQHDDAGSERARPFILSVGRLAAYKGTDVLLMSFAELAERYPRIDLVLCGPDQTDGRIDGFVRRLGLESRVRLLGDTPPRRVASLLCQSEFFVLPSREENMPMALLEAMAAGKAALASDVGGVGEAIEDEKSGLLIPPADAGALTRAMRRLLDDPRLRERLGRSARLRARLFSWSSVAASYRRLYSSANGIPRELAQSPKVFHRSLGKPFDEQLRVLE